MNVNWDDLRFFIALSRTESFVSAAIEMKTTHSTVARRISALENSLATQLFYRTEKGCRLTPAGEMLLPFAEQIESTVINLSESVAGKNNQLSGSIRIGAPDGLGNCFLASCLTQLQRVQPVLEVELIAVPMYYSLSKREIDILITVHKPTTGNIVARKLTRYRLGLFATSEYLHDKPKIRCKEDLKGHRFIGYIGDLLYDQDLEFLEEVSPGLTAHFRSSTVVAQLNAVLEGAGIGIIPYFMAHGQRSLVPILPESYLERSFWLQVNPDSRQFARVRTTIDFIAARIEENSNRFLFLPEPH